MHLNKLCITKIYNYWSVLFVILCVLSSLIYIFCYKENVFIPVHDNLDGSISILKMIKDNDLFFAYGVKAPFLGGIDRNWLPTELNGFNLLFCFFEPYVAYIIATYLRIFISVVSCLLLAKQYFVLDKQKFNIVVICAFVYGLLPVCPAMGLSFSSLPLVAYILTKLYQAKDYKWCLLLFFYPLLSHLVFFGIFICGYLALFICWDWYNSKKIKWHMVLALLVLSIGYLISEYRLIYINFIKGEISLRSVGYVASTFGFLQMIKESIKVFMTGHYHSGCLINKYVVPILSIYLLWNAWKEKSVVKLFKENIISKLFVLVMVNALFYGLNYYPPFRTIFDFCFPMFKGINLARTVWLNSFILTCAFCLLLFQLREAGKDKLCKIILAGFACSIFVFPETYNVVRMNAVNTYKSIFRHKPINTLTYREFYAEKLFEKIKKDIGYKGEYSVAFGFHPAVLQYNNISILDGYLSYYPYSYKQRFRKVIAPALEQSKHYQQYFDNWGGRAYVFSKDISFEPYRHSNENIVKIPINIEAFKELGGKYIFSRVQLSNTEESNLLFDGKFSDSSSPYIIYVYHVS